MLFAGSTVVVAILGLFIAGLPALTADRASPSHSSSSSRWSAAITLLPGLLGLAGTKIDKLSIHRKAPRGQAGGTPPSPAGGRTTSAATRCATPSRSFVGAAAPLAAPVLGMRIGTPDDGNAAEGTTQRNAYDLLADGFGPGFNGPIQVVVDVPEPTPTRSSTEVHDALAADPGVAAVTRAVLQRRRRHRDADGRTRRPRRRTRRTDDLVRHLRRDVLPAAVEGTDARVLLTGQAMVTDLVAIASPAGCRCSSSAIVAMSFVLLMIVFRSVLVPLKAALMNLLSIAAAYGVIVAVFQWGWGNELDRSRGHHADQPVRPADDVRHPLRPLDGLRGVPPVPGP